VTEAQDELACLRSKDAPVKAVPQIRLDLALCTYLRKLNQLMKFDRDTDC